MEFFNKLFYRSRYPAVIQPTPGVLSSESAAGGVGPASVPHPPVRPGIPVDSPYSAPTSVPYSAPPPTGSGSSELYPSDSSSGLADGLPMIPKPKSLTSLPPGHRSLYITALRKSNYIRVHHRLQVRNTMTDRELFALIREGYNTQLLGFWRRWFTLKGLKCIRILEARC
jgi:hypothetical protein